MEVVTCLMKQTIAHKVGMTMGRKRCHKNVGERFQAAADRYRVIEFELARHTYQHKKIMAFSKQLDDYAEKGCRWCSALRFQKCHGAVHLKI